MKKIVSAFLAMFVGMTSLGLTAYAVSENLIPNGNMESELSVNENTHIITFGDTTKENIELTYGANREYEQIQEENNCILKLTNNIEQNVDTAINVNNISTEKFYVLSAKIKVDSDFLETTVDGVVTKAKGNAMIAPKSFRASQTTTEGFGCVVYAEDFITAYNGVNHYNWDKISKDLNETLSTDWAEMRTIFKVTSENKTVLQGKLSMELKTTVNKAAKSFCVDDISLKVADIGELLRIEGKNNITIPVTGESISESYKTVMERGGIEITVGDSNVEYLLDGEYQGVSIKNNVLTVESTAYGGQITLIAKNENGQIEFPIMLTAQSNKPSVENLRIYKENGRIKYSYLFHDPYKKAEGNTIVCWYYSPIKTGEFTEIEIGDDWISETDELYKNGYLKLSITPVNADNVQGTVRWSDIIKVSDTQPTAYDISLSGKPIKYEVLTLDYKYESENLYDEGATDILWYRSDRYYGEYTEITGEVTDSYRLKEDDVGQYIKCKIIPKTQTGIVGEELFSKPYGPIKKSENYYIDNTVGVFEGNENAFADGGFENGELERVGNDVSGYLLQYGILSAKSGVELSDESFEGTRSMRVKSQANTGPNFEINAESGKLYLFSAWIKMMPDSENLTLAAGTENGDKNLKIFSSDLTMKYDSALNSSGANMQYNKETFSKKSWKKFTKFFYLQPDEEDVPLNKTVNICLATGGNVEYLIDNVYLGEAKSDTFILDFDIYEDIVYSKALQTVTESFGAILTYNGALYPEQVYTYSVENAPEGVSISSNGVLSVPAGVTGSVTIKAYCKMEPVGIEYTAEKTVAIEDEKSVALEMIYLNDIPLEGFDKDKTSYFVKLDSLDSIPVVTASHYDGYECIADKKVYEDYTISVITVKNGDAQKSYFIYFYDIKSEYENLVYDGGFESGYNNFSNAAEVWVTNETSHTGDFSSVKTGNITKETGFKIRLHKDKRYLVSMWIKPDSFDTAYLNNNPYIYLNNADYTSKNEAWIYQDNLNEAYKAESSVAANHKTTVQEGVWTNISEIVYVTGSDELCTFTTGVMGFRGYIDDVSVVELKDFELVEQSVNSENVIDGAAVVQYKNGDNALIYTVLKTDNKYLDTVSLIVAQYDKESGRLADVDEIKYASSGLYTQDITTSDEYDLKLFLWTNLDDMIPLPYSPELPLLEYGNFNRESCDFNGNKYKLSENGSNLLLGNNRTYEFMKDGKNRYLKLTNTEQGINMEISLSDIEADKKYKISAKVRIDSELIAESKDRKIMLVPKGYRSSNSLTGYSLKCYSADMIECSDLNNYNWYNKDGLYAEIGEQWCEISTIFKYTNETQAPDTGSVSMELKGTMSNFTGSFYVDDFVLEKLD